MRHLPLVLCSSLMLACTEFPEPLSIEDSEVQLESTHEGEDQSATIEQQEDTLAMGDPDDTSAPNPLSDADLGPPRAPDDTTPEVNSDSAGPDPTLGDTGPEPEDSGAGSKDVVSAPEDSSSASEDIGEAPQESDTALDDATTDDSSEVPEESDTASGDATTDDSSEVPEESDTASGDATIDDSGAPEESDTASGDATTDDSSGAPEESDTASGDATTDDSSEVPPALCGDGLCSDEEHAESCPEDCPSLCGDGLCSPDEGPALCEQDCAPVVCDDLPVPEAPSFAPHPGAAPGTWETTTVDGFTDDYLVRADGALKIGIRRDWGASIIFFGFTGEGPGTNTTNTIDSHDTGREVQVAFYDGSRIVQGCAHDASCVNGAGPCINSITYLGWNPVQGGNECNIGSGTEWVSAQSGILSSETIPLFWNPDWLSTGCDNGGCSDPVLQKAKSDVSYTQALRWVSDHVVEMTMVVQNLSALDHPVTLQEFPTLYATFGHQNTPDLHVIMNAQGQEISVDEPANDGFFFKAFESPGGWAALQNADKSYGVGLYYENELGAFQGWQKPGVFNNIRSQFPFAIPAFGTVQGRAYLVLGSYGTISAEIAELQSGLAPFGHLESPAPDALLGAPTVTLKGWALDNRGVSHIRARINGAIMETTSNMLTRTDVCLQWPLYPKCPEVGFEFELDLSALSPCQHLLEIEAIDTDGNARIIARQRINLSGGGPLATCGDGVCAPAESCPADCQTPEAEQETLLFHRYLFAEGADHDHMFGMSLSAPAGYTYEGPAFYLFAQDGPGLSPFYQSYCAPCTDHLQGTSADEGAPSYTGHTLLGYIGTTQSEATPTALQRVYSAELSDHFVSSNADELSALEGAGYVVESTYWVP